MLVLAARPAFARPCEGVHRSMSLMSSSLLIQQCPACLLRLPWIVFVVGDKWPYCCYFVGCQPPWLHQLSSQHSCFTAVKLFLHTFSERKCSASIQQYRYDNYLVKTAFHFIGQVILPSDHSQSMAVHAFASRVLMLIFVDETLSPRWVNLSTCSKNYRWLWRCHLFD